MIRNLMLTVAVVAVAIFFGFPYLSWSAVAGDDHDMELSIEVEALCNGYRQDATFTRMASYDELLRPSYWDYLDGYWSFGGEGVLPDYPYLAVVIQEEYDSDSRQTWRVPYTYGETLVWSGEYPTYHDELLIIQLHIYHDKGYSSLVSWNEIVP